MSLECESIEGQAPLAGGVRLALGLGPGAVYAPQFSHAGSHFWLAVLLAIGAFVLIAMAGSRSGRAAAGGAIVASLGVALLIGLGYGYRSGSGDLTQRLLPPSKSSAAFAAASDASYQVDATVDGTSIHFLVDTGASDVVLRLEDATRLGLDPSRLDFSDRMTTSDGVVRGANVTLDEMKIGAVTVYHLPAMVTEGDLDVSLLGMRFLARLAEVTIKDGVLTIRQ